MPSRRRVLIFLLWTLVFTSTSLQSAGCDVFRFFAGQALVSEVDVANLYLNLFTEFGSNLLGDSLIKDLRKQNDIFELAQGVSANSETLQDALRQLEQMTSGVFEKEKLRKAILARLISNRGRTEEQNRKERSQSQKIFENIKVLAKLPYKAPQVFSHIAPDSIALLYQNGNPLLLIKEQGLDSYSVIDGEKLTKSSLGNSIPDDLHGAPNLIDSGAERYLFFPQKENVPDELGPQIHLLSSGAQASQFKVEKRISKMQQMTAANSVLLNQTHYLVAISRDLNQGVSRMVFSDLVPGNRTSYKGVLKYDAGTAFSTLVHNGIMYMAVPDRAGDLHVLKFNGSKIKEIKIDINDGLLSQTENAPGLVKTMSGRIKMSYVTAEGVNFIDLAQPKLINQVVRPEISSNFMKRVTFYQENGVTYGVVGNDTGLYRLNYDAETLERLDGPYIPYSNVEVFENQGQHYALFTEERRKSRFLTLYGLSSGVEVRSIEYPRDSAIGVMPYRIKDEIRALVLHKEHMEILKLVTPD